jgi:PAS domain S-box-containing protein
VTPGLFDAPGTCAALLRGFDWRGHPMGRPEAWPPELQALVRSMLRSRGPMFVCWGPRAHLVYNDEYAHVLRDKHPAAMGQPFREVWAEVGPELDDMLAQVMRGEGLRGEDVPFAVRRDGEDQTAWFSFVWNPLLAPSGEAQGFYCSAFETTLAVEDARLRAAASDRMARMFEQAPGFIASLSGPEHVYEQANEAYLSFVGRRDIVGYRVRDAVPEALEQGWVDVLDEVYRSGEPYIGRGITLRLKRHGRDTEDEVFIDFVFQPMRGTDGAVNGILIQGHDVTEHKLTQDRLRESEAKFRTIADAMPQMVWSTLPNGYHDYYNQQWYAFTGVRPGSTDGEGWNGMFHPEDQPRAWERWRHSLATGETYEIEYRLRHRSGEYRWVLGRALPLRDDEGRILRWMGTCTDIHDRVRAQELLREEDQRKDEFLAMLAHELRNPLAPIASAVALLPRIGGDGERVKALSEVIGRQVRHMRGLIDDLLDVSRVTRGLVTLDMQRLDVRSVLAEALEQTRPLMERRSHRIELQSGSEPLAVSGDRKRLVQVFANVLTNAAKYTPPNGRVVVEAWAAGDEVRVVVRDNGQGMSAGLIEHVFDLFVQGERTPDRSQGGLGIGLALVKRMIDLHGGRVLAHSDGPGQGSAFEITLPRAEPVLEAYRPQAPAPHPAAEGTSRVLVVDDNHDAGQVLAMLLQQLGYEVYVESTGAQALHTARLVQPHVCLLDIGLPDVDGRGLAAQLRALPGLQQVAIAMISGYGQARDIALSSASGLVHFVKPVEPDALARWLFEVLGSG